MPLIKCEDCGQMVSDRASTCPNCGAPIVKRVLCEECGSQIPSGATLCPTCGCPVLPIANVAPASVAQTPMQPQYQPQPQPQYKPQPQPMASAAFSAPRDMEQRVQRFLVTNRKFFPQERIEEIRSWLMTLNDAQMNSVECLKFKDPMIMLLISFLVGEFGVDRFMLGDTSNGALKLILSFLCIGLIWWLIDLFIVTGKTLEYNYEQLHDASSYIS